MKQVITLPYGSATMSVKISAKNLVGVYSPQDVIPISDVKAEIRRVLANPIGSPSLAELVRGKKNVVLVADDNTRLTPTDVIIPVLLDELNAAGMPDEKISIVIALGTHRFMTDQEILAKFGPEVINRVVIKNHPFKDPAMLVDLGKTENGTNVLINRDVYEADCKIGIGSIVPHHIPGFAGGAKIIQPGVSGEVTTAHTHLLSVRAPRSYLGVLENPVRTELDEIARKVGLDTILNTVLNRHGQVVKAFFGDVVAAFREGVQCSKDVYSVQIPAEADIVVASSHPCDIEFWQAHKTLYSADRAIKAGGIIIVVTPCYEGVAKTHGDILEITSLPAQIVREMVDHGQVHDKVAAALAIAWAQVKEREKVFIVSEGICADTARQLGFTKFPDVQSAVDKALELKGEQARVTVLTHAPDMLPIIGTETGNV